MLMTSAFILAMTSFAACEGSVDAQEPVRHAADRIRPIGDLALLASSSAYQPPDPRHGHAKVPDRKIAYDIEALFGHPDMQGCRITVLVQNQHVTLTGRAPTGTQSDWAESAARSVLGVLSVRNTIRIAR